MSSDVPQFGQTTESTANPDGTITVVKRDFYAGHNKQIERSRKDNLPATSEEQAYTIMADALARRGNATQLDFSVIIDPKTRKITRVALTRTTRDRI